MGTIDCTVLVLVPLRICNDNIGLSSGVNEYTLLLSLHLNETVPLYNNIFLSISTCGPLNSPLGLVKLSLKPGRNLSCFVSFISSPDIVSPFNSSSYFTENKVSNHAYCGNGYGNGIEGGNSIAVGKEQVLLN